MLVGNAAGKLPTTMSAARQGSTDRSVLITRKRYAEVDWQIQSAERVFRTLELGA
jgi:hypothetical protein